jgi:hypothetical protein
MPSCSRQVNGRGEGREDTSGYLEGKGVNIVVYLDDVWYAAEYSACGTRRGEGGREKGGVKNQGDEKIIGRRHDRDEDV